MSQRWSSKALEANLEQTRIAEILISPEHQRVIEMSRSHRGINQKTFEFFQEYHHPYSNRRFVVERWREIMLRDAWFYKASEDGDYALLQFVEIAGRLLREDLDRDLVETLLQTLLEFIGAVSAEQPLRETLIHRALDILREHLARRDLAVIRSSRYLKTYLSPIAARPEFSDEVFHLTRVVLENAIHFWESTSEVELWFDEKHSLFQRRYGRTISSIGKPYFAELRAKVNEARTWQDLAQIPSFDEIANRFRDTASSFDTALERIYFVVYLLGLPGMDRKRDTLLWDMNRLLKNIHREIGTDQIISFAENLLALFGDLRFNHPAEVLDCLVTLGKELVDTEDQGLVDEYVRKLIQLGFAAPGEIRIDEDWQVQVDANHIRNIRAWLALIEYSPFRMRHLLAALLVNLRLGGVFISDTDLFQRDVTGLLNAEIAPIYKQVKELARIFPVYFNEIGAEGELRDLTTTIDELAFRRDRLIHFLRKQTHTESNSTHIDLVRRIIRFWYSGSPQELENAVPPDVIAAIDLEGELFVSVHEIVRNLCREANLTPERILELSPEARGELFERIPPADEMNRKRVEYLARILALLKEKYSFEVDNITSFLKKSRFVSESDTRRLGQLLAENDAEGGLKQIYDLMAKLKEIILNPEPSEGWENIYHKRHVAAGIPSMYGEYREAKFEALGLTFRLENVASRLIERVVDSINLDYVTTKTLRRTHEVLRLFEHGLELDGVVSPGFSSSVRMLGSSFASASFSLDQYVNIFEFLEQNVREIIEEYYLRVYDPALRVVIPQLADGKDRSREETRENIHKRSEEFYRGVLSSSFLTQTLDSFISNTMSALRNTADRYSKELVREMMTYDPDLIVSPLCEPTPRMDNQIFLGAKAFFLKKLIAEGFPVPPGFVLTTEVFRHKRAVLNHAKIHEEIGRFIRYHLSRLEEATGQQFGSPDNPLLLSVRAGTAISMPGAMNTILNVGMNDDIAEGLSRKPGLGRTAWDCYRRFLQSWGMNHGIDREPFDEINADFETRLGIRRNIEFTPDQMKAVAQAYRGVLDAHNVTFDVDPYVQLWQAIINVMDSWSSERSMMYRENLQVADEWGTAVTIQKMVLGNLSHRSGSGVLFTHDPYESRPGISIYGDYAVCAQGEDIVSGWVHALPVTEYHRKKYQYPTEMSLESTFPSIYKRLLEISEQLVEKQGLGPQEIEFTFENDRVLGLYILQTRRQEVRTPPKREVFKTPHDQMELVGRGIGIGGGALSGILAFDMEDLQYLLRRYPHYARILVRPDTVSDDIGMIFSSEGLVTGKGGATSHAAVTAARLGKVCVVGCRDLEVDESAKVCTINGVVLRPGDKISIDGDRGSIYRGHYPRESVDLT